VGLNRSARYLGQHLVAVGEHGHATLAFFSPQIEVVHWKENFPKKLCIDINIVAVSL
jgi:hypothetical protein